MRLNEREILILEYLKDHPMASTADVARAIDCRYNQTSLTLGGLFTKHLVGRQASLMGGRKTLWTVGEPVKL